jgi:hypothetical protein
MKKLVLVVVALVVALSVVPAMAGDKSVSGNEPAAFQALRNMPALEQTALAMMTDKELASVEGAVNICTFCANAAYVSQNNVNFSAFSKVRQSNRAYVRQEIN